MRVYECENCHSVFIVNESDDRIKNGDYSAPEKIDCPMCYADMKLLAQENNKEDKKE